MNQAIIIAMTMVFMHGCDYIQPDVEKSKTEKAQLFELKTQNGLIKEQNLILNRLVIGVEDIKG